MSCGPKCAAFWSKPKVCWAFLVLNILGFLGWIAGCIYVTVDGQKKMMWMWAMPWQHLFQIGFLIRNIKRKRSEPNAQMGCAQTA